MNMKYVFAVLVLLGMSFAAPVACLHITTGDQTVVLNQNYDNTCGPVDTAVFIDSADNVILDCNGHSLSNLNAGVIVTDSSGVTVKNCVIDNMNSWGIRVDPSPNAVVENNTITDVDDIGIYVLDSDNATVRNNNISDVNSGGDDDGINIENSHNSTVFNNTISDVGGAGVDNGIYIENSENCTVSNNTIDDVGDGDSDAGIAVDPSPGAIVIGNTISNIGGGGNDYGVYVSTSDDVTVQGNTITTVDGAGTDYGVYADFANNNFVLDNVITAAQDYGVYVDSVIGAMVNDNTITQVTNQDGIFVTFSDNTDISGNTLDDIGSGNIDRAIQAENSDGLTVTENTITQVNSGDGVFFEDCPNLVFSDNTLTDIGDDGSDTGVYLDNCDDMLLSGNTLTDVNSGDGIYVSDCGGSSEISENTLTDIGDGGNDHGIYALDNGYLLISDNTITNPADDGLKLDLCNNDADLSGNTVVNAGIFSGNGFGFKLNDCDSTMSGDTSTNAANHQFDLMDSAVTMSNCRAIQTQPGLWDLRVRGTSVVSTGSFFITDLIKVTFSNAAEVNMLGVSQADSGVDPTANCTDTVNFPDCVLVTPDNAVIQVENNGPGAQIDLGIVFDESKVVALGYTIDQLGIAEWDGVSDWIFLGQNDSDDWGRWVKRDGIDSFSYFGVVRFGDPSITVDGGKKSDKELDIDYEVLCPEKKVEVTVEHGSEPVSGVEVSLLMGLVVDEDTTDSDGKVTFDLSEAGDYELRASKSGYRRDEASFEFDMCGEEPEEEVTPTVEEPEEEEVEPAPEPEEEEVTETADAMNEAEQALSDAQAAIDKAKAEGKDTTEAEAKLREAEEKFQMEDFAAAKQLAEEAKALLEAAAPAAPEEEAPPTEEEEPAPVAEPEEEPEPEADYSWVLWLVVIVIIVGAGYWYFTQPKKKK